MFIFQLAAIDDGRMARNHARGGRSRPRRVAVADRRVAPGGRRLAVRRRARQPLDPLERPLDGRPVEAEPLRQLGEGRLRRLAAGLGDEPHDVRLLGELAAGLQLLDRGHLAAGRPDRPLEVRGLRVEDPVQVAAQRPRHLARLELEERARRADPPQEQPDRVPVLPGHDAAAAPEPPRRRQPEPGRADRRGPAASSPATTNSRWVRPPDRLSEPRDRNRPRSQASRQCSGDAAQSNAATVGAASGRSPRRAGSSRPSAHAAGEPTGASRRRARVRRRARRGASSRARSPRPAGRTAATDRSRRARRGGRGRGRGPQPLTRASTSRRRGGDAPSGRPGHRCAAPGAALPLEDPDDGRGELLGIVALGGVRIDDVLEHERRRARLLRRPGQRDRLRSAPAGRPAAGRLLASTTSTMSGPAWATSAATWSARSIPVVSPTWVATLQTKIRRRRRASRRPPGSAAGGGSAAGSCRGCPGP